MALIRPEIPTKRCISFKTEFFYIRNNTCPNYFWLP
jgi:hypothetical protein